MALKPIFFNSVKYKLKQKNIGRGRCSVSQLFKQSITFMRHGDRSYFGLPSRTIAAKETNSYSDSSHHSFWQENHQVSFVFLFRILVHETQRTKNIVSSGLTENIGQFSVSYKKAVERRTGMRLNRYEFIKPTFSLLMLFKLCSLHLWSDRPLLHEILTTRQGLKLHLKKERKKKINITVTVRKTRAQRTVPRVRLPDKSLIVTDSC